MVKVLFPLRGESGPASRCSKLLLTILQTYNIYLYVSEIYDDSHFWSTSAVAAHFPSSPKRRESAQRKKPPPSHCGLKISPVTTLRRARSLRSLKQADR